MISKFQLGGGFGSLFTIYQPIQARPPRRELFRRSLPDNNKEDEDSTKGKLTEKDLFSMLKDLDGLPNEMRNLVTNLTNTLKMTELSGRDSINSLATTYLNSLYKLKLAKFNKEVFDKTYEKAIEKGNLNDIAITLEGNVLALNKDLEIVALTPKQWVLVKQSEEYQPLTNSNLLWYRYQHPKYVNLNSLLLIVENGIGLEEVHKMIKDRFKEIGKVTTSTDLYLPKEVMKGHQILSKLVENGPDGYYKVSEKLTLADLKQVLATLNYIYDTLPDNAKTRLALETDTGTKESAKKIIGSMILGTIDIEVSHNLKYEGSKKEIDQKSGTGGLSNFDATTPGMFLAGLGNKLTFVINPGTSSAYIVNSNTLPLTNDSDKPLGVLTTLLEASKGNYNGILNFRSVTMGGLLVDPMAFGSIILSDGKITSIDFPCIEKNGVIMPNITPDIVAKKKKADLEIRKRDINLNNLESIKNNYLTINQIYEDYELSPAYDSEGRLLTGTWARFGVMNAQASNTALKLDAFANNPLLQVNDDEFDKLRYMKITKMEQWDDKNWPGEREADVLYKGTLWIPIDRDYVSAYIGKGLSMNQAIELDKQTQVLDRTSTLTLGRLLK